MPAGDLGVLRLADTLLEPLDERGVLLGPRALRQRAVGRVPDQLMAETECVLTGQHRGGRRHEILRHELVEDGAVAGEAAPELLPGDGRALEQGALRAR